MSEAAIQAQMFAELAGLQLVAVDPPAQSAPAGLVAVSNSAPLASAHKAAASSRPNGGRAPKVPRTPKAGAKASSPRSSEKQPQAPLLKRRKSSATLGSAEIAPPIAGALPDVSIPALKWPPAPTLVPSVAPLQYCPKATMPVKAGAGKKRTLPFPPILINE